MNSPPWKNTGTIFDFFYLHIKKTDLRGGWRFCPQGGCIEEVDSLMPRLMALNPDVVIVSGDHSTPAVLKGHSWHPVPVDLLQVRPRRWDRRIRERACERGSLGVLPAKHIMPIALANAGRLHDMEPYMVDFSNKAFTDALSEK